MNLSKIGNIIFNGKVYDSFEIINKTNQIMTLLNKYTFEKDMVVGIALDRSPELLYAILALIEIKIPYFLIDTKLPYERIKYMIDNAEVKYILTNKDNTINFTSKKKIFLDNIEDLDIEENVEKYDSDITYIIYTSGSTGKPKAVEVTTIGVENFMQAISKYIDFSAGKKILCSTNYVFDIFFLESILALYCGLNVYLATTAEFNNPQKISNLVVENDIQMVQMTPSFIMLIKAFDNNLTCFKNLTELMIGGETLADNLLKEIKMRTSGKIYNMYGPTETTIWSTISNLTEKDVVDIGEPILNTEIYILDDNLKVAGDGEIGEICIAGSGVARGYRNNQELTDKAFINLCIDGVQKRIYYTGDIGRYDEFGNLICLGRKNRQIKLRGYRIELDEIDNNIIAMESIDSCITVFVQDEVKSGLITFYTSKVEIEEQTISDFLVLKIPLYMIPKRFIRIPEFQYTMSGKVDEKKILEMYLNCSKEMISDDSTDHVREDIVYYYNIINDIVYSVANVKPEMKSSILLTNIDSIQFIKIVVMVEKHFDILFEDDKLIMNSFGTYTDFIEYVKKLTQ